MAKNNDEDIVKKYKICFKNLTLKVQTILLVLIQINTWDIKVSVAEQTQCIIIYESPVSWQLFECFHNAESY